MAPTTMKILWVDDEGGIRELLSGFLKSLGHQTETASNGREALEKVKANPPDLMKGIPRGLATGSPHKSPLPL